MYSCMYDDVVYCLIGYDTDVGNGGVAMSGGQKQRIAIARALIKKPAVLLLDEATSALDAASERVVQQSIDALQKLKAQTTIVIAHRLSTIRNVDRICVIQDGKIAEMGSHDELMQSDGLYSDLVKLQIDSSDSLAIEEGVSIADEIAESSPQRVVDGDEVKDLTDEERENLKASSSSSSPAVDEEVEVVITKEDRSRTVKLIWARVMEHKEYVVLSLVSAAFYGAVYPCKQQSSIDDGQKEYNDDVLVDDVMIITTTTAACRLGSLFSEITEHLLFGQHS